MLGTRKIPSLAAIMIVLSTLAGASADPLFVTTFNYQGRLDFGGSPYTGQAEISVRVYSRQQEGELLASAGPELVEVDQGLFLIEVPIVTTNLTTETIWIEIDAAQPGSEPVTLAPRQPYHSETRALQTPAARLDVAYRSVLAREDGATSFGSIGVRVQSGPALEQHDYWQTFIPESDGRGSSLVFGAMLRTPKRSSSISTRARASPGRSWSPPGDRAQRSIPSSTSTCAKGSISSAAESSLCAFGSLTNKAAAPSPGTSCRAIKTSLPASSARPGPTPICSSPGPCRVRYSR